MGLGGRGRWGYVRSTLLSIASRCANRMAGIAGLQNRETGTFTGDEWGEEDTRFICSSLIALSLLKLLSLVDVPLAVTYIVSCANFDGGYGVSPGAESHSGQIYACLAALSIARRIDVVDKDKLGRWLSERQVEQGGLNGRAEKLEDVCYSWWVGSSLAMIGRLHWVDGEALKGFILRCQVGCRFPCLDWEVLIKVGSRNGRYC